MGMITEKSNETSAVSTSTGAVRTERAPARPRSTPKQTPTPRQDPSSTPQLSPGSAAATTSLVFKLILALAAVAAVTGVVRAGNETAGGSVDDPPPAVFVQTD